MSKSKKTTTVKTAAKPLSGAQAAALVEQMKAKKGKSGKKQTATKPTANRSQRVAKGGKQPAKQDKPKRVSALDAAAQVLKAEGKPMRCKELIATMAERKLWTSPNGKTPEATLYAAVLREISVKGKEARFRKVDRGQFEVNG